MERRLAAILAADVVGYTRLMGADEAGTLKRLIALRRDFLEPLIARHRGRVVKLMGDGLLLEFASVVDALACAAAWQEGVAARDAAAQEDGEDGRIRFRIGINLGDVMVEGNDIHGDGVNIAARLEGLAEPGGICLSGDAYRHAKGKLDLAFEDLGVRDLKNVAEPVHVYRVAGGSPPPTPKAEAPALPDRPSIAVLPFEALGGNPGETEFSAGLAADIITELSRFGTIAVVGRHESQSHDWAGASVEHVGRALAVRYVLSGTVRRAGGRGRINAELLEVATGRPRWSERYDRPLDDPFAVQDELARAIVGIVEPILHRAEMDRISRSPTEDLQPHELMLRAWRLSDTGDQDGNREARRDCEEALRRDPVYSDAYSQLAWILWMDALNAWSDDPEATLRQALEYAERAWSLNAKDYDALGARGAMLLALGRYDAAARIVEDLARKFPGHAHATMYRSDLLSSLGRHGEALALAQESMKINPEHDQWHWMHKGTCLFCLERYAEAIENLEQFKTLSKLPFARLVLAAAYAAASRDAEARAEVADLGAEAGKLAAGVSLVYREPADRERVLAWARRAGLPDEVTGAR